MPSLNTIWLYEKFFAVLKIGKLAGCLKSGSR
jgi:hypothetical protein